MLMNWLQLSESQANGSQTKTPKCANAVVASSSHSNEQEEILIATPTGNDISIIWPRSQLCDTSYRLD